MAITKIQSESLNLADDFAFTGTITGAGESNTPAFLGIATSSAQQIQSYVGTNVQFPTEQIDTNNAFASNTFTVPSGGAGKYFLFGQLAFTTATDFDFLSIVFFKNGSQVNDGSPTANFNQSATQVEWIATLAEGDTVNLNCYHNSGSTLTVYEGRTWFGGYKITS